MKSEESNQSDLVSINLIDKFLKKSGLEHYRLIAIQGDASKRLYYRVISSDGCYILMDASKDLMSIQPFIEVASLLSRHELSSPQIFEQDIQAGLLMLEDLGDDIYTRVLEKDRSLESPLYDLAIDVLVKIFKDNIHGALPELNSVILNQGVEIFAKWFVAKNIDKNDFETAVDELYTIFTGLYKNLKQLKSVVVLRDYHADNLLYLPKRTGEGQVGLLDFQDAVMGSPAYDLVSLLEDARRDVTEEMVQRALNRYLTALPTINRQDLMLSYAILGMQRNLRIIGVFSRLHLYYKRPKYLQYLPRIWGYVRKGLDNPALADIKAWFEKYNIPTS